MAPIRKGDGTVLNPHASEVRTGDGRVLWTPDIPVSGELHGWYPWDEYSQGQTQNFADQSDQGNDLSNGSTSGTQDINSVQAGDFDGAEDGAWSDTFTSVSHPFTVLAVVDLQGSTSNDHAVTQLQTGNGDSLNGLSWFSNDSSWMVYSGAVLSSGSSSNDSQLLTAVFDEGSSVLREDGQEVATGNAGSRNMDIITVGSREPEATDRYFGGGIGEVLVYPDRRTTAEIEDDESYLNDKWGLGLSL